MARLPTSTLVLAVATAIPFGLAIKDTIAGKYQPIVREVAADDDLDDEDDDTRIAREAQRAALERAEYLAARQAEQQERREVIRSIYSDERAMPGTLFSGLKLGEPAKEISVDSPRGTLLQYAHDNAIIHTLSIRIFSRPDGECESLQAELRVAWGEPKSLDNRWIWVDAKSGSRAVWNLEDCELAYEAIASTDAWIAALPLKTLGKRVEDLHEVLGERVTTELADDHSRWTSLGIGTGHGMTEMSTDNVDGKVVAITAGFHADGVTQTLISEQITKLVGKPPQIPADRPDQEIWKATRTTPRFELIEGAPKSMLIIGTRPQ